MLPRMVVLIVILLTGLPVVSSARTTDAQAPPDIIVILLDDMRTSDWSVLTETRRLVDGTWIEDFVITTPQCCPSRSTLLTGQYAHNHGVLQNNPGWSAFAPHERDTIAVALHRAGYRTGLIGKYLNNFDGRAPPGWDVWLAREGKQSYNLHDGYSTDVFRKEAVRFLRGAAPGEPSFLWLAFNAPHHPWIPAARHAHAKVGGISKDDRDRRRTLLAVDEAVVRLAEVMGPRWDTACVVVLSDNGYLLGEHDATGKAVWWDGATRVPALVRCPGIAPGNDHRLVATIDVAPTILRAGGTEAWWPVDGRALQDAWDRDRILVEGWQGNDWRGVKGRGWLYVERDRRNPALYHDRAELVPIDDPDELAQRAAQTAALRDCAGAACRDADGG